MGVVKAVSEVEQVPPEAESNFWERWYEKCTFTQDWTTRAFPTWAEHLSKVRARNILEVGPFEGRSTIFFLNFFPQSHVTCIDLFALNNEPLFDANVVAKYPDRVIKIAGRSHPTLDALAQQPSRFDLMYIDGSHDRDDVLMDSILAWRLLAVGGILIWDDYELFTAMPGHFKYPDQDPKPAIDTFMIWHGTELSVLHSGYQVIVQKTSPHYEAA
jgi:predicted O-methyltransferase YrrM